MGMRVMWLNGTVGSGKTTVGAAVADLLADAGESVAFIDTDALGTLAPPPDDDRFNVRLVVRNLRAVTTSYREAGATSLVVAGVIESPDLLDHFTEAVGAPITLLRLRVEDEEGARRLRKRHGEHDADGLAWHLDRAPALSEILDRSGLSMTEIVNTGSPADTAAAVIASSGWSTEGAPTG